MIKETISIKNGESILLQDIPTMEYTDFKSEMLDLLKEEQNHCVSYFAFKRDSGLQLMACIANDHDGTIALLSHKMAVQLNPQLESLTQYHFPLHIFEREIYENHGIKFIGHPWLKPVRFPSDRNDQTKEINNYPFYKIKSEELHEVGVGPIHAGIIEPGHFRFTCNGEMVLHLEIQLGWQHRGVEQLFLKKENLLQRNLLAENISGDTAIGHSLAFVQIMESLGAIPVSRQLNLERAIALELERIAINTGDISALCVDVAYNLGASVFSVLRTGIINLTQEWCGNRLGKGMIRTGGTNYRLTPKLKNRVLAVLEDYEKRFVEMSHYAYKLPSVENRFDGIGVVTTKQARLIGSVGMAARAANVRRDIRESHPFSGFSIHPYEAIVLEKGDVFARFLLRRKELKQSMAWIRETLKKMDFTNQENEPPIKFIKMMPSAFSVSLTEGWRGEICHCAVTDENGQLAAYKIKDPSMHNWKSLELSLRNLEISDFPINNKSYNLSYCGHDL
ncbi:MAG: NADH dehydrogenase subunit [Clostridia bacterium]|nr:NADH dehydrogenase subunit [Clostridia bacterium]